MYSTENKTSANDATKSSGKIIPFDTKYEPEAYNVAGPSKPKSEEPYKEEKKGGGSGKIITFDTKYEPEADNVAGPSKAKKAKRKPKSEEPYKEEKKGGGEI